MKHLFTISWLLAFVGICYLFTIMPTPTHFAPPPGVDEKLWRKGMVMYRTRCSSCHNPNPDLPGVIGPKLRGVSEELLTERLSNGKGGMPIQRDMLRFVHAFHEFLK